MESGCSGGDEGVGAEELDLEVREVFVRDVVGGGGRVGRVGGVQLEGGWQKIHSLQ